MTAVFSEMFYFPSLTAKPLVRKEFLLTWKAGLQAEGGRGEGTGSFPKSERHRKAHLGSTTWTIKPWMKSHSLKVMSV